MKPAEDGSPFHIQADVRTILTKGWAGMIAHPECRFLCGSGLHWNARGKVVDGRPRAELTAEALDFALMLWNADIGMVALENSVGILSRPENLGKATQIVQPYQFGHDASKATCWWLRGIEKLTIDPALYVPPTPRANGKAYWANQTDTGQNRLGPSATRSADRARTYPGIADGLVDAVVRTIGAAALRSAA